MWAVCQYGLLLFVLLLPLSYASLRGGEVGELKQEDDDYVPIIGILSQPWSGEEEEETTEYYHYDNDNDNTTFIIAASYVKWLEAGGARSVAIPYEMTISDDINELLDSIDGVLFPGGGSDIPQVAWRIWSYALSSSQQYAHPFPLWGTCLGFEYLVQMAAGTTSILESNYDAYNITLPLDLTNTTTTNTTSSSVLYSDPSIANIIKKHNNITMNNHHQGLKPSTAMSSVDFMNMFQITSTNVDRKGKPFVSTIENLSNSIFGVQYHPEKSSFEYGMDPDGTPHEVTSHSKEAIELSLHLSSIFVQKAREYHRSSTTRQQQQQKDQKRQIKSSTYPPVTSYPMKHAIKFEEYYIIPNPTNTTTTTT